MCQPYGGSPGPLHVACLLNAIAAQQMISRIREPCRRGPPATDAEVGHQSQPAQLYAIKLLLKSPSYFSAHESCGSRSKHLSETSACVRCTAIIPWSMPDQRLIAKREWEQTSFVNNRLNQNGNGSKMVEYATIMNQTPDHQLDTCSAGVNQQFILGRWD